MKGIYRYGSRRIHLVRPTEYVDQVDRRGRVIGPPIPRAQGHALCGAQTHWIVIETDPVAVSCRDCLKVTAGEAAR